MDAVTRPDGIPVSPAEMALIQKQFDAWRAENESDVTIQDFATKHFFDADDNSARTPEDTHALSHLPVLKRVTSDAASYVPPLEDIASGMPALEPLTDEAVQSAQRRQVSASLPADLPELAAAAKPLPALEPIGLPALDSIAKPVPALEPIGLPALEDIAKPVPALELISNPLPALELINRDDPPKTPPKTDPNGRGARTLEDIPALEAIPGLEALATTVSANLAGLDNLPVLDIPSSVNFNAPMDNTAIGQTLASLSGMGMHSLTETARDIGSKDSSFISALAQMEEDRGPYKVSAGAGGSATRSGRPQEEMLHGFNVLRDNFASNPTAMASVYGSPTDLASFVAALRTNLAAASTHDVRRVQGLGLLNNDVLRRVVETRWPSDERASFMTAAASFANAVQEMGCDDKVCEMLRHASAASTSAVANIGLKKPTVFIKTMDQAWGRLMSLAIKDMGKVPTPDNGWGRLTLRVRPIATDLVKYDRKTKPEALEKRVKVWGHMAGTILNDSTAALAAMKNFVDWQQHLDYRLYLFHGFSATNTRYAASVTDSLLTETTAVGKVKKGLKIIARDSAKSLPGDEKSTAEAEIRVFLTDFIGRRKSTDKDAQALFFSAGTGLIILNEVLSVVRSVSGLAAVEDEVLAGYVDSAHSLLKGAGAEYTPE